MLDAYTFRTASIDGREVMLRVIFDIFDDLGGCPRFTRKQKAELWEHRKCGQ